MKRLMLHSTWAAVALALPLFTGMQTASAQDDDDGEMFDDIDNVDNIDDGQRENTTEPEPEPKSEPAGDHDGMMEVSSSSSGMASGSLGIGFSTTSKGISAIEAEYWISEKLAATGFGRLRIISEDAMGVDTSIGLQVGFGALYVLKAKDKAALLTGARFLLGYLSTGDSVTSIAIEAPLRLQIRPHERISIHLEGGMVIDIGDQTALSGTDFASFGFGIGTNNLFGAAGMTFYFD